MNWRAWACLAAAAVAGGCSKPAEPGAPPAAEPGEELSGGATTVVDHSPNAFGFAALNMRPDMRTTFFVGNSFFRLNWVGAPASTAERDGLGPLLNAHSCSGCHFKDGRGQPPEPGGEMVSMLMRLSRHGAPDPAYGGQLQNLSLPGIQPEGRPTVSYTPVRGTFADGTGYELLKPSYRIENPAYGPLAEDLEISPRVAPQMPGMGLLAAIPEADILAHADPDDTNHDGISGRPNYVNNEELSQVQLGRFGWKANVASVREQVAGAFLGDLGLTSRARPHAGQATSDLAAARLPNGGDPEVSDQILDAVVFYSETLAVPARRNVNDPQVLAGKALFKQIGCATCHVPTFKTGEGQLPELSGQTIHPYTDLLIHDMGADLADGRPDGQATGREWRTPPLWGIGLVGTVNRHTRFLHDGRARNLEEAILWHGGEAQAASDAYKNLPAADRQALVRFLNSL